MHRQKLHPSGRIIILERETAWRDVLYQIEKDFKISGMIYFVISIELFSGKFKLECVETKNIYLENNYLSFFYDDPVNLKSYKKNKTIGQVNNIELLPEITEECTSEVDQSEITFDGNLNNDNKDTTVSPPIPFGRSSNRSNVSGDIMNIKPSPEMKSPKSQRSAGSDGKYLIVRFLWKC